MQNKILIIAFLFIILLPLVLGFSNINFAVDSSENRALISKPQFTLEKTTSGNGIAQKIIGLYKNIIDYKYNYDRYYTDNFIFKQYLFKSYNFIKSSIFDVNPLPEKVVKGDSGWFFLGDSYSNDILESKGLSQFNNIELEKLKSNLQKRKEWLKENNIEYFVAIAPSKLSIYGEYLQIKKSDKKTKLQQLKELSAQNDFNVIDLSDNFKYHKNEKLYYKTSTHWNDLGAFLGYQKLIQVLQKKHLELKPIELGDCNKKIEISYQDDLTKLLNIYVKEDRIFINYKNPKAKKVQNLLKIPQNYNRVSSDYENRYISNANKTKVLIFRDSFSSALIKFISENFGSSVFIWINGFDKELIIKEKPDIVITEIAERDIDELLNDK